MPGPRRPSLQSLNCTIALRISVSTIKNMQLELAPTLYYKIIQPISWCRAMLWCFLFLFLQLLNNQEIFATRLYSSYNQVVSVPDSLLAPVSVIYRHRNNVGTVRRVERFGVRTFGIFLFCLFEFLSDVFSFINSLSLNQYHDIIRFQIGSHYFQIKIK